MPIKIPTHGSNFEGLTYKQIALRLSSGNQFGVYKNLSSKAVLGQLARARAKIRKFFSDNREV